MLDIFYYIFLWPFEQLFYVLLNFLLGIVPVGWALVGLSVIINAIYIPIQVMAKRIEDKEVAKQKLVKADVKEIKKHYKGEEAFRKIEAAYKKHNYSVFLSFRSNLSLLVMIPFFVAAVLTLDNNPVFSNVSFLGIGNLAVPDGLLFGINILPFVMTIVNIASIKLVEPDKPLFSKSNAKLIILALLFLAFLYNKSASLLVYWTCNNMIFLLRAAVKLARK